MTDIDNTLFDWVHYYTRSFGALLDVVAKEVSVPRQILAAEAKQIFTSEQSIEYPFVLQEMPSVNRFYDHNVDLLLNGVVELGRQAFLKTASHVLKPYSGVVETLAKIKADYPHVPIVALTDAPRYVAMWKLNKLGLLRYFDAVYGLGDPKIPICQHTGRVKVTEEILIKHLRQFNFEFQGKIRVLPDDYEKPGTKGLKTVLMDYHLDEDPSHRERVVGVGDSPRKDSARGKLLGVRTALATYGGPSAEDLAVLSTFSPEANIHKNAVVYDRFDSPHKPDVELGHFNDLLTYLRRI